MRLSELLETIRSFDGVLELAPTEGGAFPEIAWGDHFFYNAPDGQVPQRQPYATIITKNYPDDTSSDLDRPGRWRLNVHVGVESFVALIGEKPRDEPRVRDYSATDVVLPHPVYSAQGWVSIVNPGTGTRQLATRLLREAHDDDGRRAERRGVSGVDRRS